MSLVLPAVQLKLASVSIEETGNEFFAVTFSVLVLNPQYLPFGWPGPVALRTGPDPGPVPY